MHGTYRVLSRVAVVLVLIVAAGNPGSVAAADNAAQGGISLRAGMGNHFERFELAWESPSFWNYRFSGNWGRLALFAELGAAYWTADGSRNPSDAWQFSAIPMLRWTVGERYYLQAGVGPTAFNRTRFAGERIGSAFQFGSHLELGAFISSSSRLGLRVSHVSNAGIERPNPGLEVFQLIYTFQY